MTILEQEVLELINQTIDGQYISKLKVVVDDDLYCLQLYMNQEQSPLVIAKQCQNEDEFKKLVKKEIKTRKLEKVSYWRAIREIPAITESGENALTRDDIVLL